MTPIRKILIEKMLNGHYLLPWKKRSGIKGFAYMMLQATL